MISRHLGLSPVICSRAYANCDYNAVNKWHVYDGMNNITTHRSTDQSYIIRRHLRTTGLPFRSGTIHRQAFINEQCLLRKAELKSLSQQNYAVAWNGMY